MTDPTDAADAPDPAAADGVDIAPETGTETDETSSGRGGGATKIVTAVGVGLGLLAVGFVLRTLVRNWSEVSEEIRNAETGWLALAVVLAIAGMTSIGWGWRHVLRLLGVEAPPVRVIAWYYVGELGKYLPGGVWPVLGRGELARHAGIPRSRAYASVALSLGMLYLAGMFVAAAFLPFAVAGTGFSPWMLTLLALPVGVAMLHHEVLGKLVGVVARLTKREIDVEIPRWSHSLVMVARYIPTWLFIGTATYAVARSLTPDVSYTRMMFATVLSWVVGFLAVPVPSGAGIRETVLFAASGLPKTLSVTTAVVARVIFIGVDVLGALLCAPIVRRRRGGAVIGPLPHDDVPA